MQLKWIIGLYSTFTQKKLNSRLQTESQNHGNACCFPADSTSGRSIPAAMQAVSILCTVCPNCSALCRMGWICQENWGVFMWLPAHNGTSLNMRANLYLDILGTRPSEMKTGVSMISIALSNMQQVHFSLTELRHAYLWPSSQVSKYTAWLLMLNFPIQKKSKCQNNSVLIKGTMSLLIPRVTEMAVC